MSMASTPDRKPSPFEIQRPSLPIPPINAMVLPPYQKGMVDLRWDDPSTFTANSKFTILGVNIYRSDAGEYYKLNDDPIGALFYRDQTIDVSVVDENVSNRFKTSWSMHHECILVPAHTPITKPSTNGALADSPNDVIFKINGTPLKVARVTGYTGDIELNTRRSHNIKTGKFVEPILPSIGVDTCTLSYSYTRSVLPTSTSTRRTTYKVTTVAVDPFDSNETVESRLEDCNVLTVDRIEETDWIWSEAVKRNAWILDQGGERVKVFLRKFYGTRCLCWNPSHKQAENDCQTCLGTGWVGGYDGPYNIIIAPSDGAKTVTRDPRGLVTTHQYEVFMGPSPLLSQRDFIVRQNGDRYTVGGITLPSARGMILQQQFSLSVIPESDIRYRASVSDTVDRYPETREVMPMITDNPGVDPNVQRRGRTPTFGKQN